MAAKEFWQIYLKKVVKKMVTGKKWYEFSLASLRTFRELGLARTCEKDIHVIEYDGYIININALGQVINIVHGTNTYSRNPLLPNILFSISLPVENIDSK